MVSAMEHHEEKTMKKQTKSIPKALMLVKVGGQQALDVALRSGEILEINPPHGGQQPFYAFTSYTLAEQKRLKKSKVTKGTETLEHKEAIDIEASLSSMEIHLDIKGQEREELSKETIDCLQDTIKSGNSLIAASTQAVMALDEDFPIWDIHLGPIPQKMHHPEEKEVLQL